MLNEFDFGDQDTELSGMEDMSVATEEAMERDTVDSTIIIMVCMIEKHNNSFYTEHVNFLGYNGYNYPFLGSNLLAQYGAGYGSVGYGTGHFNYPLPYSYPSYGTYGYHG